MALAQGAGPVSAAKPEGDRAIQGAKGGQSRNVPEIVRNIRSDNEMMRVAALGELSGNARALAYLAATSEHRDVNEASLKHLLKDKGLFKLLEGLTGRCPEPWERELILALSDHFEKSGEKGIIPLQVWHLRKSKFFPAGSCPGSKGAVEFIDATPAVFSAEVLAGMIEAQE